MYICMCNALREKQVEAAAGDNARTVAEVFRRCGSRPKCGKCLPEIAQKIEDARALKAGNFAIAAE